jgi:hypothetical protein
MAPWLNPSDPRADWQPQPRHSPANLGEDILAVGLYEERAGVYPRNCNWINAIISSKPAFNEYLPIRKNIFLLAGQPEFM